jgi:hypothetical protein
VRIDVDINITSLAKLELPPVELERFHDPLNSDQ